MPFDLCNGNLSKTDGSRFDQDNEELRKPRDVLRGRQGHSDTHLDRSKLESKLISLIATKYL